MATQCNVHQSEKNSDIVFFMTDRSIVSSPHALLICNTTAYRCFREVFFTGVLRLLPPPRVVGHTPRRLGGRLAPRMAYDDDWVRRPAGASRRSESLYEDGRYDSGQDSDLVTESEFGIDAATMLANSYPDSRAVSAGEAKPSAKSPSEERKSEPEPRGAVVDEPPPEAPPADEPELQGWAKMKRCARPPSSRGSPPGARLRPDRLQLMRESQPAPPRLPDRSRGRVRGARARTPRVERRVRGDGVHGGGGGVRARAPPRATPREAKYREIVPRVARAPRPKNLLNPRLTRALPSAPVLPPTPDPSRRHSGIWTITR